MKKQNRFPPGWNDARVQRVLDHRDTQSDIAAVAEDEAAYRSTTTTGMKIPASSCRLSEHYWRNDGPVDRDGAYQAVVPYVVGGIGGLTLFTGKEVIPLGVTSDETY